MNNNSNQLGTLSDITFDFKKSPNHLKRVNFIIIHASSTNNIEDVIEYYAARVSDASAHFIVDKNGHILQMVKLEDIAYHCRKSVFGHYRWLDSNSIGIQVVGGLGQEYTEEQYQSIARLCIYIGKEFNIPLDRRHILGHNEISCVEKQDPFPHFKWLYLMKMIMSNS